MNERIDNLSLEQAQMALQAVADGYTLPDALDLVEILAARPDLVMG